MHARHSDFYRRVLDMGALGIPGHEAHFVFEPLAVALGEAVPPVPFPPSFHMQWAMVYIQAVVYVPGAGQRNECVIADDEVARAHGLAFTVWLDDCRLPPLPPTGPRTFSRIDCTALKGLAVRLGPFDCHTFVGVGTGGMLRLTPAGCLLTRAWYQVCSSLRGAWITAAAMAKSIRAC